MTGMVVQWLESCEKVILDQLKVLKEYQKLCENALLSIKKLQDANTNMCSLQNPNILALKQILSEVIKGSEAVFLNEEANKCFNTHANNLPETTPVHEDQNQKKNCIAENVQNEGVSCNEDENKLSDLEKFSNQMQCFSGPKVGVKYQVEVKSPLANDGAYWVRPIEKEIFQNRLQLLSDFLRKSTAEDQSLWKVQDFSKILCVKSSKTNLWMRVLVEKHVKSEKTVRYIDYGTIESCQEKRLSAVPDYLAKIPQMAFRCSFFEKAINLGYEAKWKFSDLTKKQVLNFTCEKILVRDGLNFCLGKLETIAHDNEPSINISSLMLDCHVDNEELVAIRNPILHGSRDVRTKDSKNNFTVVAEVIKKDEEKKLESVTTKKEVEKVGNSSTIILPKSEIEESSKIINWGDCKTPSADDYELTFEPLDEKVFETQADIKIQQSVNINNSDDTGTGKVHKDITKSNVFASENQVDTSEHAKVVLESKAALSSFSTVSPENIDNLNNWKNDEVSTGFEHNSKKVSKVEQNNEEKKGFKSKKEPNKKLNNDEVSYSLQQAKDNSSDINLKSKNNFEIKTFSDHLAEHKTEWIARELCNLTHPYLEDRFAQFFLKICFLNYENQLNELKYCYENQCLFLKNPEVEHFSKLWQNLNDGPIFIVLKKAFDSKTETNPMHIGICQVLGPIVSITSHKLYRYMCSVRFISTATIEWSWNRKSYEIDRKEMRYYLNALIQNLQSGKCTDFFKMGQIKEISQEMNNQRKSNNDEDWDLDLNSQAFAQSQNYGSDDESERDINVDFETFGLTQKDLTLLNPS